MEYSISATSTANNDGLIKIKEKNLSFGTTKSSAYQLPNPAELFLSSFAACVLKNVERFSGLLHFKYDRAAIIVKATRINNPPRIVDIRYELGVFSKDEKFNIELLKKNIEKYGTIFNTIQDACLITGSINKIENYV